MAKEVITKLVDDMDSTKEADGTKFFSVDGTPYVIDLARVNLAKFDTALKPFIDAASLDDGERPDSPLRRTLGRSAYGQKRTTVVGGRSARAGGAAAVADQKQLRAAIRLFAEQNGLKVAERGRIREGIVRAYTYRNSPDGPKLLAEALEEQDGPLSGDVLPTINGNQPRFDDGNGASPNGSTATGLPKVEPGAKRPAKKAGGRVTRTVGIR